MFAPKIPAAPPNTKTPSLKSTFANLANRGPKTAPPKPGAPPQAGAMKPGAC